MVVSNCWDFSIKYRNRFIKFLVDCSCFTKFCCCTENILNYTYIYSLCFRFPPQLGLQRVLSRVPSVSIIFSFFRSIIFLKAHFLFNVLGTTTLLIYLVRHELPWTLSYMSSLARTLVLCHIIYNFWFKHLIQHSQIKTQVIRCKWKD